MPRNPNNINEFIAGVLPTITFEGKKYYVDGRLKEMRQVDDHFDKIYDDDEVWEKLSKKDKSIICFEFAGSTI